MDQYAAVVSLMFLAFFEVAAVCWVFGKLRIKFTSSNVWGVFLASKLYSFCVRCLEDLVDDWEDARKSSEHLLSSLLEVFLSCIGAGEVLNVILIKISTAQASIVVLHYQYKCQTILLPPTQCILISSIAQYSSTKYEKFIYPLWAELVGVGVALVIIVWIPLGAIQEIYNNKGSLLQVSSRDNSLVEVSQRDLSSIFTVSVHVLPDFSCLSWRALTKFPWRVCF